MQKSQLDWTSTPLPLYRELGALNLGGLLVTPEIKHLKGTFFIEEVSKKSASVAALLSIHNFTNFLVQRHSSLTDLFGSFNRCEKMLSYAMSEREAGSDVKSIKTTYQKEGSSFVINGGKMFVSGIQCTDFLVTLAKNSEEKISCFLIDKKSPGFEIIKVFPKLGWNTNDCSEVKLTNVTVDENCLLGVEEKGLSVAMEALQNGRILVGTCPFGALVGMLD